MLVNFDQLQDLGDEPGVLVDLFGMFRVAAAALLEEMGTAAELRDATRVGELAHEAKGAWGSLGIERMAQLATEIEQAARQADWAGVETLRTDLAITFEQTGRAIEEHLRQ